MSGERECVENEILTRSRSFLALKLDLQIAVVRVQCARHPPEDGTGSRLKICFGRRHSNRHGMWHVSLTEYRILSANWQSFTHSFIITTTMIASMSTASGLAVRGRIRLSSPKRHHPRRVAPPRAVPVPLETLLALAEVGDVEAPSGAIFIAAAIATVAVLLVPFGAYCSTNCTPAHSLTLTLTRASLGRSSARSPGLKSGTDAANEMQARDSKSGRWRK